MNQPKTSYVLGSSDQEIERLDRQSASIEAATRLLLRAAGITPGMRVLDLGTGIGHVAMLVADLVGPQGSVVAIDSDARLLEVAASRASARPQLRFLEGDVRSWRDTEPFDAVVGRLILFHLADPVSVLRHHAASLSPAGLLLALDFDLGSCRTEPPLPLATEALGWVQGAFRSAGANPVIGARLGLHARCGRPRERSGLRSPGLHRAGRSRPHRPCSAASCARWCRRSSRPGWPRRSRSASTRSKHVSPTRCRLRGRCFCRRRWWAPGGGGASSANRARLQSPAAPATVAASNSARAGRVSGST